jgi:hypothetical protein
LYDKVLVCTAKYGSVPWSLTLYHGVLHYQIPKASFAEATLSVFRLERLKGAGGCCLRSFQSSIFLLFFVREWGSSGASFFCVFRGGSRLPWPDLAPSWRQLGSILASPGPVLGTSWRPLGVIVATSRRHFGTWEAPQIWVNIFHKIYRVNFGCFVCLAHFGAMLVILAPCGPVLVHLGILLAPSWPHLG